MKTKENKKGWVGYAIELFYVFVFCNCGEFKLNFNVGLCAFDNFLLLNSLIFFFVYWMGLQEWQVKYCCLLGVKIHLDSIKICYYYYDYYFILRYNGGIC